MSTSFLKINHYFCSNPWPVTNIETPVIVYHGGSIPNEDFFKAGDNCVAVAEKPCLEALENAAITALNKYKNYD